MASKILVADDSIVIQKSIGITFAQEDYAVEFVGNGEDALQKLQTYPADLILADVTMPKMGGMELSEKLRGISATQQTPILLLAGANDAMSEGKAKSCGANGFIGKPFDSNDLLQKVKSLLSAQAETSAPSSVQDSASDSFLGDDNNELDINIPSFDDAADTASSFEIRSDSHAPSATAEFVPFDLDQAHDDLTPDPQTKGPRIDFGMDAEEEQAEDAFSSTPTKEMNLHDDDTPQISSDPFQLDAQENAFGMDSEPSYQSQPSPFQIQHEDQSPKTMASLDTSEVDFSPAAPARTPDPQPAINQADIPTPELTLSDAQIENIVAKVFKSVIENIAWEVVPDMAEKLIREEIQRLTSDDDTSQN